MPSIAVEMKGLALPWPGKPLAVCSPYVSIWGFFIFCFLKRETVRLKLCPSQPKSGKDIKVLFSNFMSKKKNKIQKKGRHHGAKWLPWETKVTEFVKVVLYCMVYPPVIFIVTIHRNALELDLKSFCQASCTAPVLVPACSVTHSNIHCS